MKKNKTIACLAALIMALGSNAQVAPKILGDRHAMLRLDKQKKFLLLPVEEKEEYAHIRVVRNNQLVKTLNCRLAVDKVDYFVPYEVGEGELFDISFNGNTRATGAINDFACWKRMSYSDSFDTKNVEKHRPVYHHTPAYGWMNDPNGMFYKDSVSHLFYQFNPYVSQWENMTW